MAPLDQQQLCHQDCGSSIGSTSSSMMLQHPCGYTYSYGGLELSSSFGSMTSLSSTEPTTPTLLSKQLKSSSSTAAASPSKPRRSVKFSEYSMMYVIPNRYQYTVEERSRAHYNDQDYDRFREDASKTLKVMNTEGRYPDTDEETFRGLELRMDVFAEEKKKLIHAVVNAVLKQQKQSIDNILDDEWIQNNYSRLTGQAVLNSQRIGLYDAQVAFELFQ